MRQNVFGQMLAGVVALSLVTGAALADNKTAMDRAAEGVSNAVTQVQEGANKLAADAQAKAAETAKLIEESQQAARLRAGLLAPIYVVADALAFSWFYWIAFALMFAGVVSWALQLILGKLVVASAGGFDMGEIISDSVVLAISVVGLVLTTQAAAQNSNFTTSSVAVLSSAIVGLVAGLILYYWGQRQELEAAKARSQASK